MQNEPFGNILLEAIYLLLDENIRSPSNNLYRTVKTGVIFCRSPLKRLSLELEFRSALFEHDIAYHPCSQNWNQGKQDNRH